ncbi:MAG: transcriptional regulator [Bacillota bacterium]|nr:transcriptional regulator [Bacillota bacterium]
MAAQPTGTRGSILEFLKRSGGMTAADLGRELGVSPMAARQHLAVLEAEGLVEANLRRSGVGRPSSVYRLTEKGQETFPRLYDAFLILVLKAIREQYDEEGLQAIWDWRTEYTDHLHGPQLRQLPPRARVRALADLLEQTGHMVEFSQAGDEAVIVEHNCPIARVSREFPEICHNELTLLERLIDLPLVRDACMAEGADVCRYRIKLPPS